MDHSLTATSSVSSRKHGTSSTPQVALATLKPTEKQRVFRRKALDSRKDPYMAIVDNRAPTRDGTKAYEPAHEGSVANIQTWGVLPKNMGRGVRPASQNQRCLPQNQMSSLKNTRKSREWKVMTTKVRRREWITRVKQIAPLGPAVCLPIPKKEVKQQEETVEPPKVVATSLYPGRTSEHAPRTTFNNPNEVSRGLLLDEFII